MTIKSVVFFKDDITSPKASGFLFMLKVRISTVVPESETKVDGESK